MLGFYALGQAALGEVGDTELQDYALTADAGAYTWTGQASTLLSTRALTCAVGSYTWSGQDATLRLSMPADVGSYTWSGQSATFSVTMPASAGAYTWSGEDALLRVAHNALSAAAGSYTWTGGDASLQKSILFSCAAGSFAWSGGSIGYTLNCSATPSEAVGGRHFLFAALGGIALGGGEDYADISTTFSWTGYGADLRATRRIGADAGAFAWSGQDALFSVQRTAATGVYTWTGYAAGLNVSMPADVGAYTWTGYGVVLKRTKRGLRMRPGGDVRVNVRSAGSTRALMMAGSQC